MSNFATATSDHLMKLVQSIAPLSTKTFKVYNQDELSKRLGAAKLPAAGILYEGTRSGLSDQKGISGEIVCSVLLLCESPSLLPAAVGATRESSLELLDDLRKAIIGERAPTGHFWQFVLEAPAGLLKDQVIWLQRWSTKVQVISQPR